MLREAGPGPGHQGAGEHPVPRSTTDELYVIEVNPRASRTVPYISKVTGVPMVDLATRVMLGETLKDLGYGTGLYRAPPYVRGQGAGVLL